MTKSTTNSAADSWLAALNPEQRRAVEHDAGPLLIIAGAGSGKTNTLAHRVAHLVVRGADPRRILLLTFSRRAAAEMTRRVERIAARALKDRAGLLGGLAWSGTFHAIGARLLREYAPAIGLDRAFTIHDREDSADLINLVRHDLGLSKTDRRFPAKNTCLAIYSRAVNAEAPLEEVLGAAFPWCGGWEDELRALFAAYVEAKQRQNVLDYDDLLLYWSHMMAEGSIAAEVAERFDHVLVDEYQDTNRLQASILLALKPTGDGLTVVGDDAQSIYAFRAATVRNILDFPHQFSPAAEIVTLERNYRSTQPILAAANAVIELASERFTKNLWSDRVSAERPALVSVRDETEQARYVVDTGAGAARGGPRAQAAGRAVSRLASLGAARDRAGAPQHPVRQVRRPALPRGRPRQGRARLPALGGESARPGGGLPRPAPAARRRAGDRRKAARPGVGGGRSADRDQRVQAARRLRRGLAGVLPTRSSSRAARRRAGRPSSTSSADGTSRISTASTRTP